MKAGTNTSTIGRERRNHPEVHSAAMIIALVGAVVGRSRSVVSQGGVSGLFFENLVRSSAMMSSEPHCYRQTNLFRYPRFKLRSAWPIPTARPRKFPQQDRSKVTVRAIREATLEILIAAGSEGLNTNDVAAWAGVSIGTLDQYFSGKESAVR